MLSKISRASILLAAFSQHMFGSAFAQARAGNSPRPNVRARHNPAGSKPAGTRGMHHAEFAMPFRPMAHGKLGKKSGQGKRDQRMRQRSYTRFVLNETVWRAQADSQREWLTSLAR